MLGELLFTLGVVLIVYAIYKLSTNNAKYFEDRNLKYRGLLLYLKGLSSAILSKYDILTMFGKLYNVFPDVPIYGQFDFNVYQYVVRDPEAVKRITIKDFDYFQDHRELFNENVDELFGSGLFNLQGERWRQMRATLSPAFTGSKMRQMFELLSECADEIVEHFQKRAANGEKIDIEMKDFFSRYTNDVIATCAFGVKVNSMENPDNEFYVSGRKMTNLGNGIINWLKFLTVMFAPRIAKFYKIRIFDASAKGFFQHMITDTMDTRQNNNIRRNDLIDMLIQVRQGKLDQQQPEEVTKDEQSDGFASVEESLIGKATVVKKWSDTELIAQCFQFFLAGFEFSSSTLTFTTYELVANPEIQRKLYEEIAEVNKRIRGKRITYDVLQKMKYMDQVVSEALRQLIQRPMSRAILPTIFVIFWLRKWPAPGQIDRLCIKDYIYDDGKLKFKIEKGSNIVIPVYGFHRDPKFYPDPENFDPERFSDENKHKILPGSYLPFGSGPRNCIGSRFALVELKAILYYLLLNFSFEVNKDTQIPLKLRKTLNVAAENGVHLELRPRSN